MTVFHREVNPYRLTNLLKHIVVVIKHIQIFFNQGTRSPGKALNQLAYAETLVGAQLQAAQQQQGYKTNQEVRFNMYLNADKDRPGQQII